MTTNDPVEFWQDLLEKYIDHVHTEEGTDFIESVRYNDEFSEEEKESLKSLRRIRKPFPGYRDPEWSESVKKLLQEDLETVQLN